LILAKRPIRYKNGKETRKPKETSEECKRISIQLYMKGLKQAKKTKTVWDAVDGCKRR
jgi:hypothetical protein